MTPVEGKHPAPGSQSIGFYGEVEAVAQCEKHNKCLKAGGDYCEARFFDVKINVIPSPVME